MFETARCIIKITTDDDSEDLYKLYSDQKVWEYLGGYRDRKRTEKDIQKIINPDRNITFWTVREKVTNVFLGLILLAPHHNEIDTEISYEFISSCWGKGYAAETIAEVIQHAFQSLGLKRLVAETQLANISSCKMLKKLGFNESQRVMRFGAEQIIWMITKLKFSGS